MMGLKILMQVFTYGVIRIIKSSPYVIPRCMII